MPDTVPGREDPEGHRCPLLMEEDSEYTNLEDKGRPPKGEQAEAIYSELPRAASQPLSLVLGRVKGGQGIGTPLRWT